MSVAVVLLIYCFHRCAFPNYPTLLLVVVFFFLYSCNQFSISILLVVVGPLYDILVCLSAHVVGSVSPLVEQRCPFDMLEGNIDDLLAALAETK